MELLNYSLYEGQIQLRSSTAGNVSERRLARLIGSKVRNCIEVCFAPRFSAQWILNSERKTAQKQNAMMLRWQDRRWRFGSGPGYIGVGDIQLLGVVFVSPGKVTPLLRVRTDFGE